MAGRSERSSLHPICGSFNNVSVPSSDDVVDESGMGRPKRAWGVAWLAGHLWTAAADVP